MKKLSPSEVTEILLERIEEREYKVGDVLPTLDELNEQFFGVGSGPKPGRTAYAPLIEAGMVEARQGRYGGHFVISSSPMLVSDALESIAADLKGLGDRFAALRDRLLHVVEFVSPDGGSVFGECLHTSRFAAERYANDMLLRLGEDVDAAEDATARAGFTAATVRPNGHGVRIYGYTLGGERTDTQAHTGRSLA